MAYVHSPVSNFKVTVFCQINAICGKSHMLDVKHLCPLQSFCYMLNQFDNIVFLETLFLGLCQLDYV